jgi:hypothetical protein
MITTAMILLGSWISITNSGPVEIPAGCTTEQLSILIKLEVPDQVIQETCNKQPIIKIKREKKKACNTNIW